LLAAGRPATIRAGMGTGTHASRRALALAAAVAIGLAGCGSSDDTSDAEGPAAGLERKIEAAQAKSKAAPSNPAPLAALAKLHFQAATLNVGSSDGYGEDGKKELRLATQAWERYLALDPQPVDTSVAQLMSAAYAPGSLDQPKKAVAAQRVLAANTRPPDAAQFAQLAQKAYYAGETRTGDAAAARAIELTPKSQRAGMRETMKTAKQLTPQR
jgi:hypothetical protein